MAGHPFWHLAKPEANEHEMMLLNSIVYLSLGLFRTTHTFEQVYDLLKTNSLKFDGANASFKEQLNRIEEIVMSTSASVQRLQADEQALLKTLTDIQAALVSLLAAQADAEARLEADIANLRNQGGNGDPAALDAIATSLESTQAAFASVTDQLKAAAQGQLAVDPVPAPTPAPPPVTLSISPSTVSTLRSSPVQFSANLTPVTFGANKGSIDANGLYTPPTDTTVTSDTVMATYDVGGMSMFATAIVSITD